METKSTINHYLKWKNSKESLSLYSLFVQWFMSLGAQMKARLLSLRFVQWAAPVTRLVCQHLHLLRSQGKRHLVGIVLLGAGLLGYLAGPLFFSPDFYDHVPCEVFGLTNQCFSHATGKGWCFMSWYVLLENTSIYIAILFWSVAAFIFIPRRFSGYSFVIFSFCNAFAWVKLAHILFFARSAETFRAFPQWQIIILAAGFAIGIMLAVSPLLYWENHKKRGNWQKWPAIFRSPLSQEEKNRLYAMADEEYEKVNRMI